MCSIKPPLPTPIKKDRLEVITDKRNRKISEQAKQKQKRNSPTLFNGIREFINYFNSEQRCIEYLEIIRWSKGKYCPYCGIFDITDNNGIYICNECKQNFTVKTGTIFESGRISLQDWFTTIYLENSFIGGVTGGELERQLPLCRKSALVMVNKVREYAYNQNIFKNEVTIEGKPKVYMLDTMSRDGEDRSRHDCFKRGHYGGTDKKYILVIIQEGGEAKGYSIDSEGGECVLPIIYKHIPAGAIVHTDEHASFNPLKERYQHFTVNHKAKEYGSTNRVEGWNSFFQTGLMKFRNSISSLYTQYYVNAASFRYNTRYMNETEKLNLALENIFANPVDKNKEKGNFRRASRLEKERLRLIRNREHKEKMRLAKTEKEKNKLMLELAATSMSVSKAVKKQLKEDRANRKAIREQRNKDKAAKQQAKQQIRNDKAASKAASKAAREQRNKDKAAKQQARQQKKIDKAALEQQKISKRLKKNTPTKICTTSRKGKLEKVIS